MCAVCIFPLLVSELVTYLGFPGIFFLKCFHPRQFCDLMCVQWILRGLFYDKANRQKKGCERDSFMTSGRQRYVLYYNPSVLGNVALSVWSKASEMEQMEWDLCVCMCVHWYSTHTAMLLARDMISFCCCVVQHYSLVDMLSICQGYTTGTCTPMAPQKYKNACEPP